MLSEHQFGLPHPMGETPLPEGHDRYYHQTDPANVPSIREHGLLFSKAKGIEGPKGTWISNRPFYETSTDSATVEMGLPHDPRRGHIAVERDIPPDHILAIHEPWHEHARYMEKNEDVKQATLAGEHDDLRDYDHYGPAIDYIKKRYGQGRG